MLAAIMEIMDSTIANVSLPYIQGSINASQDQITWVITSYIVSSAIAMTVTSWLIGRFGIKNVLLYSIIGFVVSSMLCGVAMSITSIVIFRLLQGISGACLIPMSQVILLSINPPEKHGQAMAVWAMGIMAAPIFGPILGGWITEVHNWRWIFFINLPIGIVSFILTYIAMPKSELKPVPFDFMGFAYFATFIFALQMLLERGEIKEWFESWEIRLYSFIAIISLYLFIKKKNKEHPFIDLRIFQDRNYFYGSISMFFMGMILYSAITLSPQLLQMVIGYDVVTSGLLISPRGIGSMLSMFFIGRLIGKIDMRLLIIPGMIMSCISLYIMTFIDLNVTKSIIVISGVIQGVGFGMILVPLSTIAFTTLDPALRSQASSIFSITRNIGGAMGIAFIIFLIGYWTKMNHAIINENVYLSNPNLIDYVQKTGLSDDASYQIIHGEIRKQAALVSYINAFKLSLALNILIIPFIFFLKPGKVSGGVSDVH